MGEFQWFVLLLMELFNKVALDRSRNALKPFQIVECHLFLTRYDPKKPGKLTSMDAKDPWQLKPACVRAAAEVDTSAKNGFKIKKLWNKIMVIPSPEGSVDNMASAMREPDFATNYKQKNRVGDVWIWYGRPK